jgi:hypothetical protein
LSLRVATTDKSSAQFSAPTSWLANRAFFLGVFDWVGVELEPAIFEEAGDPFPTSKTIADVFGQL